MPKKLALLGAMLTLFLSAATTALAQEQVPVPKGQYEQPGTFTVTPTAPGEPSYEGCVAANPDPEACAYLQGGDQPTTAKEAAMQAATQAAQEAARNAGNAGDAREAAMQAAEDATTNDAEGGMGEAVNGAAAYLAALQDAREAGADGQTAQEAAEQAVNGTNSSGGETVTGKVSKGGSGKSTAAEDRVRKDRTKKDAAEKAAREDKPRKDKASKQDAASEEEETDTEGTGDEEVVAGGEEKGVSNSAPAAQASHRAPLLLSGVALLSVGGYAGLRFARSWSASSEVKKLLQN
jgi:hypothetical protein